MSVRDPVLLERRLKKMEERLVQLERALLVRDNQLIGETEHGDKVYAVTKRRGPTVAKVETSE